MPEQNQPIQGNFGDIYRVETPNLDQAVQQMQQNYAARAAFKQKEAQNVDELVNKNLQNVRSVDSPGVIDAYSNWKQLSQKVLFNPALRNNLKAYNQAEIDANSAYGDMMYKINQSTQLNQFGKQLTTDRSTPGKSNLYADDFGDKAAAFWSTPADKLQSHKLGDLSNLDTYRYKGMNSVNFGGMEKTAAGTSTPKYQKEEKVNDVQTNITPYSFGNTPAQFQDSLRGQYSSTPTIYRAASAAWESIPQQERDRVDQMYSQIPIEKWQQMGLQAPQAIAPTNAQDPADNLAAYKAKLYAINNAPAPGKMYSNVNQAEKLNLTAKNRLHGQEVMAAINEGNREKLAGVQHDYKQLDTNAQSQVLDETVDGMLQAAKAGGTHKYISANGQVTQQYEIPTSPGLKKVMAVPGSDGKPIYPDAVRFDPTNKTVTPLFFEPGQTGNVQAVDSKISKPMTFADFKATVGKTLYGAREASKESTPPGTHIRTRTSSGITWQ
jgi:hypothetical protein